MKKLLVSIIVLVLVMSAALVVFAACEEPTDYDHTIVFYSSQGDALQKQTAIAIAAFEAKYPGWTVKHTPQGGYDEVKSKVISDLQGGLQPDLAYCYADHVAHYIETQKVVDLNKYINSTETVTVGETTVTLGYTAAEIADFVPGYYAEGLASNYAGAASYGYEQNAMLTLPFVKSTELLYYNADALQECGLPVAQTWDELWEQCEILKDRYPNCTPLGYDSEANWFITMCEQNGWGYTSADESQHYLFNNADAKAWLEQINEYYNKGYITTQEDYGAYTSALFTMGVQNDKGGVVYCIGSSGGASHQDPKDAFNWGIAPVPGSKQTDGSVNLKAISQGPSLVMLTGGNKVTNPSEKEKMTFLFMKELLDPTFQASFSIAAGYNPSRKSAAEVEAYIEHIEAGNITAVAAEVAMSLAENYFTSPAFVGSSTARVQVGNALVFALVGTKTADKALQDAYKNCGGK